MSDTVIRVEKLSKKYLIGSQKQQGYTTIRDVLADKTKFLNRQQLTPFGKRMPTPAVKEFWALKDVSFEIKQGDRVGIIGRNGAGKSTLLKILSRITEPSTGRIAIQGRVASLLEVGTGFHPELTGRENIYLNGAILGMSKAEIKNKFDEIVAFAEVERFLDTPVKRYSSGMYVRLAFAVAAHLEPEILVVDEVLAVGDAAFQKKCLGKMDDVCKKGRSVLFVSHNIQSILKLCSTSLYLEKGEVLAHGDVQTIINQYLSTDTVENLREITFSNKRKSNVNLRPSFQLKKLKLIGGDENLCYQIGECIQVEITYEYKCFIEGLKIGIGINNKLHQRLCTFHNKLNSDLLRIGTNKICLEIDTSQFKPDIYTVDVGAGSGKILYDSVEDVTSFVITPFNISNSYDDEDNVGLFSVKHTFSAITNSLKE